MKYSELKEANRGLAQKVLHWMSVAARALADVEILSFKVKRQEEYIRKITEQSHQRGDECQRLRGNEKLLRCSIGETARLRNTNEDISDQLGKLGKFILDEIPGEPSHSEGAVDTAIRLLREHVVKHAARAAFRASDPRWRPSSVRSAMDQINELVKTLPENKFLREEPLQLVILRALRRMHSSMELHKSFDTTVGRLVEAEETIEELQGKLDRAADVQQSIVETLNDVLVGQPEFNEMTAPVEERAAVCLARLACENVEYKAANARLGQKASEKLNLSFTLISTVGKQAARIAVLEEQLAAEVKGRKESNMILFLALKPDTDPEHMDSTDNPLFFANRAAQTISAIRGDNLVLRRHNERLKQSRIPSSGTYVLEGTGALHLHELTLDLQAGKVNRIDLQQKS